MVAVPLALLSGAHALSSVSVRRAPELAQAIFPWNGAAIERVAYGQFVEDVKKVAKLGSGNGSIQAAPAAAVQAAPDLEVRLQRLSRQASGEAVSALAFEPMLPKAYVLLALAETNPGRRREIIELATRLTRRDSALQGLALQQKRDNGDFAGAIGTLDQILRVHPERKEELFPLLVSAITLPETRPAFATMFRKPLPWRDDFLVFAVGEKRALENLAFVRERITIDNTEFDQRLIAGLAQKGEMQAAERLYRRVTGATDKRAATAARAWVAAYPPFDWKLADARSMRAQPDYSQDSLEFYIEPGNGGVLASRVLKRPAAGLNIAFDVAMQPVDKVADLKLQMSCWGQDTPFFEQPFNLTKNYVQVSSFPACPFVELAIVGRSWTGGRALTGTLSTPRLTPGR
jgi:hypothetical protein